DGDAQVLHGVLGVVILGSQEVAALLRPPLIEKGIQERLLLGRQSSDKRVDAHRSTTTFRVLLAGRCLALPEFRTIRRPRRAPTMQTARSILSAESRDFLPRLKPHLFARCRALWTCI